MNAYCGIDWAENHHDIAVVDDGLIRRLPSPRGCGPLQDCLGVTSIRADVGRGPEAVAGLMSGSTDIAWATPATFIPAVEEGQDILAVPPFMDLDYGNYVPEDSDIQSIEDLNPVPLS